MSIMRSRVGGSAARLTPNSGPAIALPKRDAASPHATTDIASSMIDRCELDTAILYRPRAPSTMPAPGLRAPGTGRAGPYAQEKAHRRRRIHYDQPMAHRPPPHALLSELDPEPLD